MFIKSKVSGLGTDNDSVPHALANRYVKSHIPFVCFIIDIDLPADAATVRAFVSETYEVFIIIRIYFSHFFYSKRFESPIQLLFSVCN